MSRQFFARRLAELREQRGVSARELSLLLGLNESYINRIENQNNYPTMENFLYICEYFHITPEEFFSTTNPYPSELNLLIQDLKKLNYKQLKNVQAIVKDLIEPKH